MRVGVGAGGEGGTGRGGREGAEPQVQTHPLTPNHNPSPTPSPSPTPNQVCEVEGEAGELGGTWRLRLPTTEGGAAAAGGTGAAAPALLSTRVGDVLCVCLPPAGARAGDTLLFAVPPRAAPAPPLALLDHSGGAPASASASAPVPALVEAASGGRPRRLAASPHENRSRSQRVLQPGEPGEGGDGTDGSGSGGTGSSSGGAAGGGGDVVVVELPSGVVAGERLLAQVRPQGPATLLGSPAPPHADPPRCRRAAAQVPGSHVCARGPWRAQMPDGGYVAFDVPPELPAGRRVAIRRREI